MRLLKRCLMRCQCREKISPFNHLLILEIMALDEKEWRPITFQGVTFSATLMGVSILEPVLDIHDPELIDWVWGLRICCGRERRASAEFCARCAQRSVDLMLEHRQKVLDGIHDRLGSYGFDPEATFGDWIQAFQSIRDLSAKTEGECTWSAPSHPQDMKAGDWQRLMLALEREKERLTKGKDGGQSKNY